MESVDWRQGPGRAADPKISGLTQANDRAFLAAIFSFPTSLRTHESRLSVRAGRSIRAGGNTPDDYRSALLKPSHRSGVPYASGKTAIPPRPRRRTKSYFA